MYINGLRRFFDSCPRIAYRHFARFCVRLPVSPAQPPYLLARQYKDSYFR